MTGKKGGGPSAKTVNKAKEKIIEDKTFGLKNKNKSKAVQKQIAAVKKQVQDAGLTKEDKKKLEEREAKKMERFLQKQREKELKELFNDVDADKKKAAEAEAEAAAAAAAAASGAGTAAGASSSSSGEPTEKEMLDALELLAEVENELVEEEKTGDALSLEQLIERDRAKIINGTPVTEESFKRWKAFKNELKDREKKRKAEESLELYKKKGVGLSGRALFEYNQSLFVDDEAADATLEREVVEVEVDEDLFLDDEDEDEDDADGGDDAAEDEEEYAPETWKEKDTPKSLLMSLLGQKKLAMPVFESMLQGGGEGACVKCVLPHAAKEFIPSKVFPNKKLAEHNAALKALRWLEGQGAAEAAM